MLMHHAQPETTEILKTPGGDVTLMRKEAAREPTMHMCEIADQAGQPFVFTALWWFCWLLRFSPEF